MFLQDMNSFSKNSEINSNNIGGYIPGTQGFKAPNPEPETPLNINTINDLAEYMRREFIKINKRIDDIENILNNIEDGDEEFRKHFDDTSFDILYDYPCNWNRKYK